MRAIFSYVKEDVDELSFEVGDIIQMIDYDDPKDKVNRFIHLFYNLFFNHQLFGIVEEN